MIKPITPAEMPEKSDGIPDEVIRVVNLLISNEWDGEEAIVGQDEIIRNAMFLFRQSGIKLTRDEMFDRNYLNIEDCFSKAGWEVEYKKPDRGESFNIHFVFRKPSLNDEHGD